ADWLQKVGVNKLPETLDELEQIFIKFRNEDPDGNGKKDTYALSNGSDYPGEVWFQTIFGAYGGSPFQWRDVDDKLQFGLTTQETKEALIRLNKWYEMELIDPEFITEKGKNTEVEDVAGKFASGKIGYMDNLSFDDYQYDNDGHVNFKWVVANPEWQAWFEERKDNPEEFYSLAAQKDFNAEMPQPYYINLPPVAGPDGHKGYYRVGLQESVLVFSQKLEEEQEKYDKLLQILDYINTDKPTNDMLEWGPDGVMMIMNDAGERIFNPQWGEHELFDPQITKLGAVWTTNPMRWTNPEWLGTVGGPRETQRFKLGGDVLRDYPYFENALKVTLPSQAQNMEILDTRVKEYVIKAVTGEIDVEATFDQMVEDWYKTGGEQLTKEANDWYATQS
ncbi:hypothetical protein K0U00_35820, partial [Paenibacillus sepulcri]|nr:hypothetical protein [Paenibacillus sepulcri]